MKVLQAYQPSTSNFMENSASSNNFMPQLVADRTDNYIENELYSACLSYLKEIAPEFISGTRINDEGLAVEIDNIIENHFYNYAESTYNMCQIYKQIDRSVARLKRSLSMCLW
jgi:hypothetical protein